MGKRGEDIATAWLRASGCKILYRNFRAPGGGEVDIVAREGNLLLFIEVKTRREGSAIRPLDAVNKEKQRLIERGARDWLRRLRNREIPWRFDVMEIHLADRTKPRINRVRDAF